VDGSSLVRASSAPPIDAIAASPALLGAIIVSAMDAVIALDAEQRIVLFNPAAEAMLGYPATEAIGQPLDRFLPERFRNIHRRHVENFGATGDTARAMGHLRPLAALRGDGQEFPIEATISRVSIGGRPYYAAIVRDISAREAAEAARATAVASEAAARAEAATVSAQRDELRAILEGMPSGVEIVAPPDGRIELANSAFTDLVFGAESVVGVLPSYGRDFVYLHADGTRLPVHERPGMRVLRGERVRNQQLVLERADGSHLPISAHAAPLLARAGRVERAIVVVQDTSQLHQAEQLKDDFLALISHELRTPLTAIHGGAHVLAAQGDDLDAATRAELLSDVIVESERLEQLLGNLTTLAALLAGRRAPMTEPVLLGPLARSVAAAVAAHSPAHTFVAELTAGLPAIEADQGMLEEILRNLYENAVKYAPDGGTVRTRARHESGLVSIEVIDEGIGIAAEHLSQVFDRFRRPGAPPTTRGMGLGLYLVRLLVEAQGGTISAASPGPGKGSSFTVALPVAQGWAENGAEDVAESGGGRS
jgi:PAS domain S-box-containing protein